LQEELQRMITAKKQGPYAGAIEKVGRLYLSGALPERFYGKKISADALRDYDSFLSIPFTHKREIRDTACFDRTTCPKKDVFGIFSSSGTTGDKTYYVYSARDKEIHELFVKTIFSGLGIHSDDLGGVLAPIDTGVMAHTMMWEFTTVGAGYVNCPQPSPDNIAALISTLPVTVIAGRPNTVTAVAYNGELSDIAKNSGVRKLLLGGGFLSDERRKLLERVWGAECYNLFGMSEMFGPMAGECPMKDGLHFLDEYLMIEIVDPLSGRPVPEGSAGVAVYTTLWDKGFPLVRYWTDDIMRIDRAPCRCGSKLPRLRYLGRLADSMRFDGSGSPGDATGRYVFPEALENCLFGHGLIWDYKAAKISPSMVEVTVEMPPNAEITPALSRAAGDVFGVSTVIKPVPIGAMHFGAHEKRFCGAEGAV
jgi:phenylacetate-CoA ligase